MLDALLAIVDKFQSLAGNAAPSMGVMDPIRRRRIAETQHTFIAGAPHQGGGNVMTVDLPLTERIHQTCHGL